MKAYKFRSAAQIGFVFDIIVNKRLYCADWKNLNDPMEGVFAYCSGPSRESEISKGIDAAKRQYKVCSLAGTFDSHLLWSHYAGGFDGVAIEVELPDEDPNIRPVDYRGVFPCVNVGKYTNEEDAAKDILFSKNKEWEYVKEFRILNNTEWYKLNSPVSRVIAGCRMPQALFDVMNMICTGFGKTFNVIGIGDEGLDADFVEPLQHF